MIKVATAFSGGLAACEFSMKYEELEHEVVFACEWDKYARKQYLHFHGEPTSKFYEDIQDLDATPYKDKIDLFVFGSPCQDLSLAGKRKGFLGEKSSLFRHGARVLEEMMPKVFIFENVKGLLSSNCGADYKEVIETFQNLGYLIASSVVNAKNQGTAQNRERVFVVGFLNEYDYHNFSFADDVPLTKCLRNYLDDEVDEKYFLSQKMIDGLIHKDDSFIASPDDISKTLRVGGRCSLSAKHCFYLVKVKSATAKGYEVATENDSINFTHPDSKTRRGRVGRCVAQTLDCACNQGVIESMVSSDIKDSVRKNFIRDYEEIVKSEKTVWYCKCNSGYQDNKVCLTESACLRANNSDLFTLDQHFRIRRLTPKECFRLMGVKDEDISLVNSDTQSYKIAGNGIEVNTLISIVRQLYKPTKKIHTLF